MRNMARARLKRHAGLLLVTTALLAGCGGSGGSGSSTNNTSTASSTVPAGASSTTVAASTTSTTLYVATGNSANDLRTLAQALAAVDYSKISTSACGDFAVVVAAGALRFFQWTSGLWVEQPAAVPSLGLSGALTVTSRDYTGDRVIDFLVRYRSADPVGGILVLDAGACAWNWSNIFDGAGTVKYVTGLKWTSSTGTLQATMKSSIDNSYYTVDMVYDTTNHTFVSTTEIGE